eukprot:TRINITY_DN7037_c0_g1_i1.p1 TRINITY_DN7037_c0_g1~~TRINITY_DN7037_c0_g1_i1.p1  ORF type:complete len:486 (+),score=118.66 TRINITY_DN7037_c0_g1_i1:122-1459(+)
MDVNEVDDLMVLNGLELLEVKKKTTTQCDELLARFSLARPDFIDPASVLYWGVFPCHPKLLPSHSHSPSPSLSSSSTPSSPSPSLCLPTTPTTPASSSASPSNSHSSEASVWQRLSHIALHSLALHFEETQRTAACPHWLFSGFKPNMSQDSSEAMEARMEFLRQKYNVEEYGGGASVHVTLLFWGRGKEEKNNAASKVMRELIEGGWNGRPVCVSLGRVQADPRAIRIQAHVYAEGDEKRTVQWKGTVQGKETVVAMAQEVGSGSDRRASLRSSGDEAAPVQSVPCLNSNQLHITIGVVDGVAGGYALAMGESIAMAKEARGEQSSAGGRGKRQKQSDPSDALDIGDAQEESESDSPACTVDRAGDKHKMAVERVSSVSVQGGAGEANAHVQSEGKQKQRNEQQGRKEGKRKRKRKHEKLQWVEVDLPSTAQMLYGVVAPMLAR